MITALILFYASSYLIAHSYVLYPVFLKILPKKKKSYKKASQTYSVAVVIAAFNEEKVIEEKVYSILNNVPKNVIIDIYIGSDGSTDQTNEIIQKIQHSNLNVHLKVFPGRCGKAYIVNNLEKEIDQEVLILTDANVLFTKNTIMELLMPFENDNIGLVCSNIIKAPKHQNAVETIESQYISRENKIKKLESDIWEIVIGAEGGCYAIKKEYFNPIPPNFFMDDFFMTMNVLEQKKNVLFQESSICYEDVPDNTKEEFKRKIRISIGNFQNLKRFYKLLLKINALSFAFWSHKVLRWLTPIFIIALFLSLIILSFEIKPYLYILILFSGFSFLSLILPDRRYLRIFNYIKHFLIMNLALFIGFFKFLIGVKSSVWTPTQRNK